MTAREETIWLAAILEGEGCFMVRPARGRRRPSLAVSVKMTDADVIQKAACLMQGSVKPREDNRSDKFTTCWVCEVSGAKAERVMRKVMPYMGQRRRAKIVEALATPNLSHRKASA